MMFPQNNLTQQIYLAIYTRVKHEPPLLAHWIPFELHQNYNFSVQN